jgi:hypothetical protein
MREGKPVFVIADHYGLTGLFTFYWPEARDAQRNEPLVYRHILGKRVDDQLSFWPQYDYLANRIGQNAIYVIEINPYSLEREWWRKWLARQPVGYEKIPGPPAVPPAIAAQFETIRDLGQREIKIGPRVFRRLELFECRNLKPNTFTHGGVARSFAALPP